MDHVLEVWSTKGSVTATAFVRSPEVNGEDVSNMAKSLRVLVSNGVRGIVIGFANVRALTDDAVSAIGSLEVEVAGRAQLSIFGLRDPLSEMATKLKLAVYATEEAAQRATFTAQAF